METGRKRWIVGLMAALWLIPLAAEASRILVPGIDFSGEDTKVNVPMSLIVDVMLAPGAYTDGPTPGDIMRKYQQDKNGKYDDRILPRLDDKDRGAVYRYLLWLKSKPETQIGSASQSSGQALFVPEGVSLILRPNLAQYRGIEAVYGTLGGGPPYMPGVFVPGEGWSIPFAARDVRPGTRAVMVIAIDHSNQKKARVLWFDLWNHSGEGRQYGPYEIHVTQAVDQHHRPFRVQEMDAVDVALNYCKGLAPAVTMVANDQGPAPELAPQPGAVEVPPAGPVTAPVVQPAALVPADQEVTVRLWDDRGNPLQQETPVAIYSMDPRGSASSTSLSVLGPTTARVPRGSEYTVAVPPGFALDPAPGDRTVPFKGRRVVVRPDSGPGPVAFDFRRKAFPAPPEPATRVLAARQTIPPPARQTIAPQPARQATAPPPTRLASRPALKTLDLPPTHEVVVRVSPSALGRRELPVVWVENGKAVRRSVLRPGYTTLVERFPESERVVPKAGSSRWRISPAQGLGWESQYVALPQRGGR